MKLESFACVSLSEINRLNPEEAAPSSSWGRIQPPFDQNLSPNLHLRVILPIIITPLNWIFIYVHIHISNRIFLSVQYNFWCASSVSNVRNFATLHQNSPREGGFFPIKCPFHSTFHERTSITSKTNISLPTGQPFCAATTVLNDLASEAQRPGLTNYFLLSSKEGIQKISSIYIKKH